jgi:hypothetical protein
MTVILAALTAIGATQEAPLYPDPERPVEQRVEDLISRMTLEEKAHQMASDAAAIDRLGVPQYNWWNECLHGVGRAGRATVFPQAIGLAGFQFIQDGLDYMTATHHTNLDVFDHARGERDQRCDPRRRRRPSSGC